MVERHPLRTSPYGKHLCERYGRRELVNSAHTGNDVRFRPKLVMGLPRGTSHVPAARLMVSALASMVATAPLMRL